MKKLLMFIVLMAGVFAVRAQENPYISKAQAMLDDLKNNRYEEASACFDESVAGKLTPEFLKKSWEKLITQLGPLQSTGLPRTEESHDLNIVYIPCTFEKAVLDLKASFKSNQKAVGFTLVPHKDENNYTLPPYADQAKIKTEKITVKTGKYKLPGEFVYPKNADKKFPVIVLVHGSGPNDMDETIGGNKPFKDLAYGLASKGIGVVRYDKRTKVYASQLMEKTNLTLEDEVIEDALAAIQLAKTMKGVDTSAIYVLGHSLGAMTAPRIADRAQGQAAGIIMMAGNARPLEDLIMEQIIYLNSLDSGKDHSKEIQELKKQVDMVKSGAMSPKTPSEQLPFGMPAPYWLYLNNYHQTDEIQKLRTRIMIMQGESDYQVTMQDFELWKKALKNNKDAQFRSYPKLNHLFIEGETTAKSKPADYLIPSHIPVYVIDDIAGFVNKK